MLFSCNEKSPKKRTAYRIKLILLILIICLTFVLYYTNSMNNRIATDIQLGATDSSSPDDFEDLIAQKPKVNQEAIADTMNTYSSFSVGTSRQSAFWDTIIPERLKPTVNFLISYFCHGYNGLSLAMDEDFTSSFGLGFSDFIRHNFARFFGGTDFENTIYQRTYMAKIEKYGWTTGLMWSSFFIFPASDISFPGTILLVFLIGYLFGLSWKDTITTENPFACAALLSFCTMIFYFSANNQMFQTGENCLAFCVILFAWILSRTIHYKKAKD